MSEYHYRRLPTGRNIRLFFIHPGCGEDLIYCTMGNYSLDDEKLAYTAISYAWGSPDRPAAVMCAGRLIRIPNNLYHALWQFRESQETREGVPFDEELWWADAICINQMDKFEKSSQVRMMRHIYEKAEMTLAWLGQAAANDEKAIELLKNLAKMLPAGTNSSFGKKHSMPRPSEYDIQPVWDPSWRALKNFFLLPWFSRVWTVEECVLSKNFVAMRGNRRIESYMITGALEVARRHPDMKGWVSAEPLENIAGIRTSDKIQCGTVLSTLKFDLFKESMTFLDLMNLTMHHGAYDARDKIFAPCQLPQAKATVAVDYHSEYSDARSIYIAAAVLLLTDCAATDHRRCLAGLEVLSEVRSTENKLRLPSWVPDWSVPRQFESLFRLYDDFYTSTQQNFAISNVDTLLVNAVEIDKIKLIVPDFKPIMHRSQGYKTIDDGRQYLLRWWSWHKTCEAVAATTVPYPTGEPALAALCRTMVFNKLTDVGAATASKLAKLYHWHLDLLKALGTDSDPRKKRKADVFDRMSYYALWGFRSVWWGSILYTAVKAFYSPSWRPAYVYIAGLCLGLPIRMNAHRLRYYFTGQVAIGGTYEWLQAKSGKFSDIHKTYSRGRLFGTTAQGYLGWFPQNAMSGDSIYAFDGSRMPFILRKSGAKFRLIGAGYVDGKMDSTNAHYDGVIEIE